ncbi:hypothetical protein D3C81_1044690 [compost metagenome]
MIRCDALQVAAEGLRRADHIEAVGIGTPSVAAALAVVHCGTVGGHGKDQVVGAQAIVPGQFDGADDIGPPRDPDAGQGIEQVRVEVLPLMQIGSAGCRVEEQVQCIAAVVRYADHDVGVHHVVNQGDMLVADALDVVFAIAVREHRGAFERLHRSDARAVAGFQQVPRGKRARGTCCADKGIQAQSWRCLPETGVDPAHGFAGAGVMRKVVAELRELVQDHGVVFPREQRALVVDLLDVALGTRRPHDVRRVRHPALEPVEAFAAHAFRQYRDAAAAQNSGYRHTAAAVVAGGRPNRTMTARVEAARHQALYQAAVGRQHLMRPNHRKAMANGHDDPGLDPGNFPGQFNVAGDRSQLASKFIVVPMHPPQVGGMHLVGPYLGKQCPLDLRDAMRIGELAQRGQSHTRLAQAGCRALQHAGIRDFRGKGQVTHVSPQVRLDGRVAEEGAATFVHHAYVWSFYF